MADTQVNGLAYNFTHGRGMFGPYWTDKDTGVVVHLSSTKNVTVSRTTDAGSTWIPITVEIGTSEQLGCFFDKEITGDTGDVVHIAWMDSISSNLMYRGYDISLGSFVSFAKIIATGLTVGSTSIERVSIGKARSGNLIAAYETAVEIGCVKTSDEFVTAGTVISDVFEAAGNNDRCLLFPAKTSDDNDLVAIFGDISASSLSVKMYDDSADTWTETSIPGTYTQTAGIVTLDAAARHSDGHVLVAYHSNDDNINDDLKTVEVTPDSIASPSITARTDVFTNQAESSVAAMVINQQNDDVYIAYVKGGTWQSAVDVVYHKSTDGMVTWGTEQAYSEAPADDLRIAHGGHTVGDDGGRVQFSFFNDDLNYIYVNETNDIEILEMFRGSSSLLLPVISVDGASLIHVGASIDLPVINVDGASLIHMEASVGLPVVNVSGISLIHVEASIDLPVINVDGASLIHMEASVGLPVINVSGISLIHVEASIDLPVIGIASTALQGEIGSLSEPLIASGTLTLSARTYNGSAPECVVMNTKNFAVTEYINYGFNSMTRFNGAELIADQNGIYEADDSDTDNAGVDDYAIKAHIKTGRVDVHNNTRHVIRNAWINYQTDGDIQIVSRADKKSTRYYMLSYQSTLDGINERRVKIERGVRDRFFDFKIQNIIGSQLEIDKLTIMLEPIVSKRR